MTASVEALHPNDARAFWARRRSQLLRELVGVVNAGEKPSSDLVDAFAGVSGILRDLERGR